MISLEKAKEWLKVSDDAEDDLINDLIAEAEQWVSTYTNHVFTKATKTLGVGCYEIYDYPIAILGDGKYSVETRSLKSNIHVYSGTISLAVGYENYDDVPKPLISACKKLITYLYDNRDVYTAELPLDIQVLINQYRRNIAWS